MADKFPMEYTYTPEDDDSPVYTQSQLDEAVRAAVEAERAGCHRDAALAGERNAGSPSSVVTDAICSAIRARGETK